jgi:hypothetical protein
MGSAAARVSAASRRIIRRSREAPVRVIGCRRGPPCLFIEDEE